MDHHMVSREKGKGVFVSGRMQSLDNHSLRRSVGNWFSFQSPQPFFM